MKSFYNQKDLIYLRDQILTLYFLINQLASDVPHEGPISREYIEEKINRLLEGIPIVLHINLQEHMNKTTKEWRK